MKVKEVEESKEAKDRRTRTGPLKKYTDPLIYKQAYRLALAVSKFTKRLPRHEQFELGRQLRRSARSVPANVVEGWTKRYSAAEFKRHLVIAAGEVAETKFWIELAVDEGQANSNRGTGIVEGILKTGIHDSQSLEGVEETVALRRSCALPPLLHLPPLPH